jgi:Fe-Mn family superoxide dismutase
LTALPWDITALEPAMSALAAQIHHGKHHAGYETSANDLLRDKPELAAMSPLEVVSSPAHSAPDSGLYRSAAQAWNHDFVWHSRSPQPMTPTARMSALLGRDFGGFA